MKKDPRHVRKLLKRFVQLFPAPKEGSLKVILLCFFTATTFWFFNALNKPNYTTRINYPISFNFNQDSIYLLSQLPENITVEVSGGGWNLLRKTLLFDREPVEIPLDNPTETKFIETRLITSLVENRLSGVQLDYIITDTLFLNIDKRTKKKVHLAIDTTKILLEDNYRLVAPPQILPDTATLEGPVSLVSKVPDTLYITPPGEAVGKNFSGELTVSYEKSDHLQITPDEVEVKVEVALFSLYEKRLEIKPVNFPKDSSIYLSQASATVSFWMQSNYTNLAKNTDFEVIANLRNLNPEDSTIRPVLKSPPKFARDIVISPPKVRVVYAE